MQSTLLPWHPRKHFELFHDLNCVFQVFCFWRCWTSKCHRVHLEHVTNRDSGARKKTSRIVIIYENSTALLRTKRVFTWYLPRPLWFHPISHDAFQVSHWLGYINDMCMGSTSSLGDSYHPTGNPYILINQLVCKPLGSCLDDHPILKGKHLCACVCHRYVYVTLRIHRFADDPIDSS